MTANVIPLKAAQPALVADPDAEFHGFMARAAALPAGSMAGADALVADAVASPMSPAGFKPLAGAIGKSTGLDAAVYAKQMHKARGITADAEDGDTGRALLLAENPEPSPAPRSLGDLILFIIRAINRQVVVPPHAALAVALWIVGTYGFKGAIIFPRLVLQSAAPRCGKSTLLALIAALSSRSVKADGISASAMFRLIARPNPPTICADEIDTYLGQNEDLRGVLNAGYERSGVIVRSEPSADGKTWEPRVFPVFCPVALSGISGSGHGRLPPTVADRAVIIKLERAAARGLSRRAKPLRARQVDVLRAGLPPELVAYEADINTALDNGSASIGGLPQLDDRACDNWDPLLAVAELAARGDSAHAGLVDQAKAAALALSSGRADRTSVAEQLVMDLRSIIDGQRHAACTAWTGWAWTGKRKGTRPMEAQLLQKLPSSFLVAELVRMEDRPWPEYGRDNRGLSSPRLAALLKPFGVGPSNARVPANAFRLGGSPASTTVVKSYLIADLRRIGALYG